MSIILLKPPNYIIFGKIPTVFLAGPIQGTYDWHAEAIKFFWNSGVKDLYIASPKRDIVYKGDFDEKLFNEQVDWESYYLRRAATLGCILFWLAKETEHDCRRAYAQTTRFELSEWVTKYCRKNSEINLAVGIETGFFSGERYIRRRMGQDCSRLIIQNSLLKTCHTALLEIKAVIARKKL